MSSKFVTHPGIIKSVSGDRAEVSIVTKSACVSCEINGSCSVSDTAEKIIEVRLPENGKTYEPGQPVTVKMKESTGSWAVLFGYVFPFVVILISLIVFTSLDFDQGLAGVLSLAMLVPYYFVLYLSRNLFRKKFDNSLV